MCWRWPFIQWYPYRYFKTACICFLGVEKWPELNINLYDYSRGNKLTAFSSLLGDDFDKKKYIRSLKSDSQFSTFDGVKGQWVAVGSDSGTLHLCFLPEFDKPTEQSDKSDVFKELKESLKICSFNIMENVNINTIGWRFRNKTSVNLTVLCGCSDGTLRCCILNSESSQLKLSKNVSYSYAKASISGFFLYIIRTTLLHYYFLENYIKKLYIIKG